MLSSVRASEGRRCEPETQEAVHLPLPGSPPAHRCSPGKVAVAWLQSPLRCPGDLPVTPQGHVCPLASPSLQESRSPCVPDIVVELRGRQGSAKSAHDGDSGAQGPGEEGSRRAGPCPHMCARRGPGLGAVWPCVPGEPWASCRSCQVLRAVSGSQGVLVGAGGLCGIMGHVDGDPGPPGAHPLGLGVGQWNPPLVAP